MISLLGPVKIEICGEPIKVDTRKAIALAAFLAVSGKEVSRDELIAMFWPESDSEHGRSALRRTLSVLNKSLSSTFININRHSLSLNMDSLRFDLHDFNSFIFETGKHGHSPNEICRRCISPLSEAVKLYRGNFMSGFSIRDSVSFDDWQFFQTEHIRSQMICILERLAECYLAEENFHDGISTAQRLLLLDPLQEKPYILLMQMYSRSGNRAKAMYQFNLYEKMLSEELGLEPRDDLVSMFNQIKGNTGRDIYEPDSELNESLSSQEEKNCEGSIHFVTALCIGFPLSGSNEKRCTELTRQIIEKYGGQISSVEKGIILGLFGHKQIHENYPEIAIRAVIELTEECGKHDIDISTGMNTGSAYLIHRDVSTDSQSAACEKIIRRARYIQKKTPSKGICVSESLYHITRKSVLYESLNIGDKTRRIDVFRVISLLPVPKKTRGLTGGNTQLFGRDKEFSILQSTLKRAERGETCILSIRGEPGIGKTRLIEELSIYASKIYKVEDTAMYAWYEGRCLSKNINASYWPFTDILKQIFSLFEFSSDTKKRTQIESFLKNIFDAELFQIENSKEILPMVLNILSLNSGDYSGDKEPDPEKNKMLTFNAIRLLIQAAAKRQLTILVFEDLHWSDNLSIELILYLMDLPRDLQLLIILSYRPVPDHPCRHLSSTGSGKCGLRYVELFLQELSPSESERMVGTLAGTEDRKTRDYILEQGQGNPFFLEELILSVRDSDDDIGHEAIINLQNVILGRMDVLSREEKKILECASVIGRIFQTKIISRISHSEDFETHLYSLVDRNFFYEEKIIPENEFAFRHVLVQEAIYDSLPEHRREKIHGSIARAIESVYGEKEYNSLEQIAYHYSASKSRNESVYYLFLAGEKSRRQYANREAITFFREGLEILKSAPSSDEKTRKELEYRIALGVPLTLIEGHASKSVEENYKRARTLSLEAGCNSSLFESLHGLRRFHFIMGDILLALRLSGQMLDIANSLKDNHLISRANMMAAEVFIQAGEYDKALKHSDSGNAVYSYVSERTHHVRFGNDTGIGCGLFKGLALWFSGLVDEAEQQSDMALIAARDLGHPFTLVFALLYNTLVHLFRGETETAGNTIADIIAVSNRHGFAMYKKIGIALSGWLKIREGKIREGISSLLEYRSITDQHSGGFLIIFIYVEAAAYKRLGNIAKGLECMQHGLDLIDKSGTYFMKPEFIKLEAEFRVLLGHRERDVEALFAKAIALAREMKAKSLELRASTSMAEYLNDRSRKTEGRNILEPLYHSFKEGHDTEDLLKAKNVLDSLR